MTWLRQASTFDEMTDQGSSRAKRCAVYAHTMSQVRRTRGLLSACPEQALTRLLRKVATLKSLV